MKQLMFVKKNTLEWWEAPEPTLQTPDDILVRPFAVARCDLDIGILRGVVPTLFRIGKLLGQTDDIVSHTFGHTPYKAPFAFGHECVAEVIACGEHVKHFKRGDQVIVPFQISCGHCLTCQQGLTGNCQSVETFSMYGGIGGKGAWGGALSDVVRVPFGDAMLVAIPEGIDPISIASMSDNLPDAWRTVGPALAIKPGARVLVIGGFAKSVGLYAAAMAVALGSQHVDYLDQNPQRLALAQSVGAHAIESSYSSFKGSYSIVVDASNRIDGLHCGIRSLSPGGICTSVGIFPRKSSPIPLLKMYVNDLTLKTGVTNARANIPEVLGLVQTGRFKPELLTTLLADWEDAPNAFLENSVKVIVKRDTVLQQTRQHLISE